MLEIHGEVSCFALVVPSLNPRVRAKGAIGKVELSARLEVFAFGKNAFMIVDVVLPAMFGLVHVGKASVVASSDELERLGNVASELLGVGHLDVGHSGGFKMSRAL